jgi:hypothetical protein
VEDLASILGCSVASFPIKYLGLPLVAKYKDSNIWTSITEKMETRLEGWKKLYLSKGERLTLIQWEWLIVWKNFRGIFFGEELEMSLNSIW